MEQIVLTPEQDLAITILGIDVDKYLQQALNKLVYRAKVKEIKTLTLAEIESL